MVVAARVSTLAAASLSFTWERMKMAVVVSRVYTLKCGDLGGEILEYFENEASTNGGG
jgi:hypothetical protein